MEDPNKKSPLINYCIPWPLEVEGKPYLSVFPCNVVMVKYGVTEAGNNISETVIYDPDFETYHDTGTLQSMLYPNSHDAHCHLFISYNKSKKSYECEKYLNGELVGAASGGNNWNMFFVHVGIIGITDGEVRKYEPLVL